MTTIAQACSASFKTILLTCKALETTLIGVEVRVISDHNGQPHGRSKPSWRGQIRRIKAVHLDICQQQISLSLEGHEYECFILADEVELT